LKVYQWVLNEFNKYRRHCLWRKKDIEAKCTPLATWDMVYRPKDQGGLGIINLRVQNKCLLLKHLHKFYNRADIPWVNLVWEVYYSSCLPPAKSSDVSFWWRGCLKALPDFKDLAVCSIGSGSSVLLWHDSWSGQSLKQQLPHLFSFAKFGESSVLQAIGLDALEDHFHLPLSVEAYAEFNTMLGLLEDLPNSQANDTWTAFGNSTSSKVSAAYKLLMGQRIFCPALKWLWKTCSQSKHKVFFWLVIQDRLNSRELLLRKNFFLADYSCSMCASSHLESRNHLFFSCPFAVMCWQYICPNWSPPSDGSHQGLFLSSFKASNRRSSNPLLWKLSCLAAGPSGLVGMITFSKV
jgi:hypothetical protein